MIIDYKDKEKKFMMQIERQLLCENHEVLVTEREQIEQMWWAVLPLRAPRPGLWPTKR